jgi:glycine cleavage system H lipoate-binding protein
VATLTKSEKGFLMKKFMFLLGDGIKITESQRKQLVENWKSKKPVYAAINGEAVRVNYRLYPKNRKHKKWVEVSRL